eukprot:g35077.t1
MASILRSGSAALACVSRHGGWPADSGAIQSQQFRSFASKQKKASTKASTLVQVDATAQEKIDETMSKVDTLPPALKSLEGIAATQNLLDGILDDPAVRAQMTEQEIAALEDVAGRHTFSMPEIMKIKKKALVAKYGKNPQDTGSSGVQIALWSERLRQRKRHLAYHHQDKDTIRDTEILIHKRRKLLLYIRKKDFPVYARLMRDNNLNEKDILYYGSDRDPPNYNRAFTKADKLADTGGYAPAANPLGAPIPAAVNEHRQSNSSAS